MFYNVAAEQMMAAVMSAASQQHVCVRVCVHAQLKK